MFLPTLVWVFSLHPTSNLVSSLSTPSVSIFLFHRHLLSGAEGQSRVSLTRVNFCIRPGYGHSSIVCKEVRDETWTEKKRSRANRSRSGVGNLHNNGCGKLVLLCRISNPLNGFSVSIVDHPSFSRGFKSYSVPWTTRRGP